MPIGIMPNRFLVVLCNYCSYYRTLSLIFTFYHTLNGLQNLQKYFLEKTFFNYNMTKKNKI